MTDSVLILPMTRYHILILISIIIGIIIFQYVVMNFRRYFHHTMILIIIYKEKNRSLVVLNIIVLSIR